MADMHHKDENTGDEIEKQRHILPAVDSLNKPVEVLTASKLGNQAPKKLLDTPTDGLTPIDKLLANIQNIQNKQAKIAAQYRETKPVAKDKLWDKDNLYNQRATTPDRPLISSHVPEHFGSDSSTTHGHLTAAATSLTSDRTGEAEFLRMKLELEKARQQIARMENQAQQNARVESRAQHTRLYPHPTHQSMEPGTGLEYSANASAVPCDIRAGDRVPRGKAQDMNADLTQDWPTSDDGRSDLRDAPAAEAFYQRKQGNIWADDRQSLPHIPTGWISPVPIKSPLPGYQSDPYMTTLNTGQPVAQYRVHGGLQYATRDQDRLSPDRHLFRTDPGKSRILSHFQSRAHSPFVDVSTPYDISAGQRSGYGQQNSAAMIGIEHYQYSPAMQLSPHASEFSTGSQWQNNDTETPIFMPTIEPLNYRRLLDKNVSCNWKYIVDKIVCNNDQQASIFLQQKVKAGTAEQKHQIVDAIVAQAYPLMVNRFGNFLVQRCFEHGTPEQVIGIAEAIRGNTLNLSMDAFGCHVIQKAFDAVPETYKAVMVNELLRRIPETVIHRYACHVWQKLFELRWNGPPPEIMTHVNSALRGMWHEVALGETGSLVVQNIFENCLDDDKRPAIEEVLGSINVIAHGQFGNWCIQHVCEHGAPADRGRAVDHVLRYATEYSMDQFASKVVEKCLKLGDGDFLDHYLSRVCEGRHDRPRIPLIDIASDQYGNYLIQWILINADQERREIVASHIRKHIVSLRGSKFGSRVGMLCSNPAVSTRSGPIPGSFMVSRRQDYGRFNNYR